jgi:hypothetical protein
MKALKPNMMRSIIAACLIALSGATATASSLFIRTNNAPDKSVELGEISAISFATDAVTVTLTSGTSIQIATSDFKSISTTGQESYITTISADNVDGSVDVYNLSGVKVATIDSASKLNSLSSGVYLLNNQSKTVKIVVP